MTDKKETGIVPFAQVSRALENIQQAGELWAVNYGPLECEDTEESAVRILAGEGYDWCTAALEVLKAANRLADVPRAFHRGYRRGAR